MKLLINRQRLSILVVIIVCLVSLSSCQTAQSAAKAKAKPHKTAENINSKASLYRAMAEGVTKQCPIAVDDATILIKLEYKEDSHSLTYSYLFSGGVYEDMDEQMWIVVQKSIENMLKEKLKTNQLLSQLRTDGLTLIYVYTDKNSKELFSITLLPGEY
ncbi:MAG: hypothetical protein ACTTI3_08455 [Treponema sp.]